MFLPSLRRQAKFRAVCMKKEGRFYLLCSFWAWNAMRIPLVTNLTPISFGQKACVCEALLRHYASCILLGGVWEELRSLKHIFLFCRADDSSDCSGRAQHAYLWHQDDLHFSRALQTNKHKNNCNVILRDNNVLQCVLLLGNFIGPYVETLWMGTV